MRPIPPVAAEFLARSPGSCSAPRTRRPRVGDRALRPARLHHHARRPTASHRRPPVRRATRSPARSTARSAASRSSRAPAGGCGSTARRSPTTDGVTIALEQVFSNCPKYIATRDVDTVAPTPRPSRCAPARWTRGRASCSRPPTPPSSPPAAWTAWTRPTAAAAPASCDAVDAHTIVLARLLRQHDVQDARQHRRRRRGGAHAVDPEDGTTLHLSAATPRSCGRTAASRAPRLVRLTVERACGWSAPPRCAGSSNARPATRRSDPPDIPPPNTGATRTYL